MVVFDGYKEFTTKDMTHKRRLKGKKGVSVTFSLDMSLSATQEAFLSDPKNKQQFIFLAQDSQVKVAVFSTTKQMQTCLLFKRQLSQQIQTYSSFCYTTCLHTAKKLGTLMCKHIQKILSRLEITGASIMGEQMKLGG